LMVLVLFSGLGDTKEISDDVLQYNTTHGGKYLNILTNNS